MTFRFSSLWCSMYLCLGIQTSKHQKQEIKSMVDNILQKWNHMYSSYNNNIKCVGSTIKYIGFESIHYVINLGVISSFIVFNDFDYMFLSNYCYFESIKLFFSSKKKN